jgi:hypothetical protein
MAQALVSFHVLFTRRGAPLLVGAAVLIMLSVGALFYWLEPTIHGYWDGLWLAFVTGATIGYGDFVPTTGQSRILAVFTALIGFSLVTLFTANVVTFFVGRDELQLRRDMEREMLDLHAAIERLLAAEEIRFREDLHRDVNQLRADAELPRGGTAVLQAVQPNRGVARRRCRVARTAGAARRPRCGRPITRNSVPRDELQLPSGRGLASAHRGLRALRLQRRLASRSRIAAAVGAKARRPLS